ncbi:hypothetical protein B0H66DRAFT_555943 [Apodospora peruviana]|uniref:Uncharacterized protein n=1 Tax=Apodospora peruviana TaxID=516989 RepID=A0AAE0M3H3_9PEZI|nr:hypothetical protein B0H66DRAFT_555943 [Apodospora peruviana]
MPRQLPWKVNKPAAPKQTAADRRRTATTSASPASSRSPAPSRLCTARSTPKPKAENGGADPRRRSLSVGRASGRSPSTSPPPEPLKEEFMREGPDKDDRYRMVEDEFLAVAHEFTRHIHAAEYQRLKSRAINSQNAETIQNISRPVTGEMTDLVKRRHAALGTAAKQRKGIARVLKLGKKQLATAGDNDDEKEEEDGETEETGESPRRAAAVGGGLRGLMDSPRKRAVPLISFSSNLSATAAGQQVNGSSPSASRRRRPDATVSIIKREPTSPTTDSGDDEDDDTDGLDGGGGTDWPTSLLPRYQSSRQNTAAAGRSEVLPATASTPLETTRGLSRLAGRPPPSMSAPSSAARINRAGQVAQELSDSTVAVQRSANINIQSEVDIKEEEDDDDDDDFFSRIRSRRAELRRRSAGTPRAQPETSRIKVEKTEGSQFLDEIPRFL